MYGCTAVPEYIRSLSASALLEDAWQKIALHEQTLVKPLLDYLKSKEGRGVRIVGEESSGLSRAPTISFVVVGERPIASRAVVRAFDQKGNVSDNMSCFYQLCESNGSADWYPLRTFLRVHSR